MGHPTLPQFKDPPIETSVHATMVGTKPPGQFLTQCRTTPISWPAIAFSCTNANSTKIHLIIPPLVSGFSTMVALVQQTDHKAQVKVCGIILVMNTTEKSTRSTRRKQRLAQRLAQFWPAAGHGTQQRPSPPGKEGSRQSDRKWWQKESGHRLSLIY